MTLEALANPGQLFRRSSSLADVQGFGKPAMTFWLEKLPAWRLMPWPTLVSFFDGEADLPAPKASANQGMTFWLEKSPAWRLRPRSTLVSFFDGAAALPTFKASANQP